MTLLHKEWPVAKGRWLHLRIMLSGFGLGFVFVTGRMLFFLHRHRTLAIQFLSFSVELALEICECPSPEKGDVFPEESVFVVPSNSEKI